MQQVSSKEYPLTCSRNTVRGLLAGTLSQIWAPVSRRNSDTIGQWSRLIWDDSKLPSSDLKSFADHGFLHVPASPHRDDPQDDLDCWTRWRVFPKWHRGDVLWVQEQHSIVDGEKDETGRDPDTVFYRADETSAFFDHYTKKFDQTSDFFDEIFMNCFGDGWQSARHMPRWASRFALQVTSISAQRLHSVNESAASASGCNGDCGVGNIPAYQAGPCVYHFAQEWDKRHYAGSWDQNPWTWAVSFIPRCLHSS